MPVGMGYGRCWALDPKKELSFGGGGGGGGEVKNGVLCKLGDLIFPIYKNHPRRQIKS